MKDLAGGVAVVTGAAQGIGRGIARALAADGCRVVVSDLSADGAEAVAEELRGRGVEAIAASCDVRERAQVEALAETAWGHFGRVDLLVNNAGVIQTGAAVDATEADMQWVFGVNLFGCGPAARSSRSASGSRVARRTS